MVPQLHSEVPSGSTPGTSYTLSTTPPNGLLSLTRNGLFQTPGVDYSLSGTVVTLVVPTSPGDGLQATWVAVPSHGEIPSGATPGSAYTLSGAPPTGALQSLTKNGVFMTLGVDYMLSGATITLAVATSIDDTLYAVWLLPQPGVQAHSEVPAGTAPTSTYTLSSVPANGLLSLTRNGVLQTLGVDYTLSGAVVTLTIPTSVGTTLYATWLIGSLALTITLSQDALSTNSSSLLQVYEAPPIPTIVVQANIYLANASLVQARWEEAWWKAMGLFVSHYNTLWLETEATDLAVALESVIHGETPAFVGSLPTSALALSAQPPGGTLQALYRNGVYQTAGGVDYTLNGASITLAVPASTGDGFYAVWPVSQQVSSTTTLSPAQIAAQGVANGIQVSKSVGDVSASYQTLTSLEAWGAWNLTKQGQQLATMAQVVGAGPMVIW